MKKYIINHVLEGYEKIEIGDSKLDGMKGQQVVLVLGEESSEKLSEYYTRVRKLLINNNRIYLIIVGKESKIRLVIASLLTNYGCYHVYRVESRDIITEEYVGRIEKREPSIEEVQVYIGGDVASYADINIILSGIKAKVISGDMKGLKEFTDKYYDSIEDIIKTIEYMKKLADMGNSGELFDRINELKEEIERVKRAQLEAAVSSSSSGGGNIMQTYSEINTSLLKCKVSHVLYFKEISYVPYTNTMIQALFNILKMLNRKVKLIIYDNMVGLSHVYRPLSVIGGTEFVANKDNLIHAVESFVVVEPNPMILTSILESVTPQFEIVIVYDRMRQITDIVTGNNVTKFYVINSNSDYQSVKGQLRINDVSTVITRPDSTIGKTTLNIPKIEDFTASNLTSTAKLSRYKKLQCANTNKQLLAEIFKRARIEQ